MPILDISYKLSICTSVIRIFNYLRICQLVIRSGCTIFRPHWQCPSEGAGPSPPSPTRHRLCIWRRSPGGCEAVCHGGFSLCFPDGKWHWASFCVSIVYFYIFTGKTSIQILPPFLIYVVFFGLSCKHSLYILDTWFAINFIPFYGLSIYFLDGSLWSTRVCNCFV